jgi:hypothetical protein
MEFVLHDSAIMPAGALNQGYKGFGLCVFTLSATLSDRRFASVHLNPRPPSVCV